MSIDGNSPTESIFIRLLFEAAGSEKAKAKIDSLYSSYKRGELSRAELVKKSKKVVSEEETTIDKLKGSLDKLTEARKRNAEAIKNQNKANVQVVKNMNAETGKLDSITMSSQRKGAKGDETFNEVTRMSMKMSKSNSMWLDSSTAIGRVNKGLNALRWSMVNIMFALAIAIAIGAALVKLGKFGAETEILFKRIEVVTKQFEGDTVNTADNILESIKDLRQGTMFSLEEMGTAYLEFTKQGFSASEALKAMPAITALATVGFTDLGTATKMVAQVMHQFNLTADESVRIASVLAKAANLSAADVETFGIAMSYAGSLAAQAGMSFEDTASALAILSNRGLTASKSGTSFAAMMTQMITPTDGARETMENLGVAFFDAEGNMKDLADVVEQLDASLNNLSSEDRLAFLVEVFQTRGARAMSGLIDAFDEGQASIEGFSKALEDNSYVLEKAVDVHLTSSKQIKSAWEDIKTSFVDAGMSTATVGKHFASSLLREEIVRNVQDLNKYLENEGKVQMSIGLRPEDDIGRSAQEDFFGTDRDYGFGSFISSLKTLAGGGGQELQEMSNYQIILMAQTAQMNKLYTDQGIILQDLLKAKAVSLDTVIYEGQTVEELLNKYAKTAEWNDQTLVGISEMKNALYSVRDATNEIITPQEKIKGLNVDLKNAFEDGVISLKDMNNLTETESFFLAKLINNQISITGLTKESLEFWKEILVKVREVRGEIIGYEQSLKGALNIVTNALKDLGGGDIKQLDNLIKLKESITGVVDGFDKIGFDTSAFDSISSSVDTYIKDIEDSIPILKEFEAEKARLEKTIDEVTAALKREKRELAEVEAQLKKTEDSIKNLTKARYKNQTATERLMAAGELWLKKQKLSDRGIGDAQTYIQEMLDKSAHGYDKLYDSINNVNDAVLSGKESYEAWKETVEAFIKDTVTAGNQMSNNVSGAITKYQTLLLSTSKYSDAEEDKYKSVETTLRNLQDAYDIYYGGMEEDVKFAVQEHEESANGIYNSSEEVIGALQDQWKAQAILTTSVINHKSRVADLTGELELHREAYDGVKNEIKGLIGYFEQLENSAKNAYRVVLEGLDSNKELREKNSKKESRNRQNVGEISPYMDGPRNEPYSVYTPEQINDILRGGNLNDNMNMIYDQIYGYNPALELMNGGIPPPSSVSVSPATDFWDILRNPTSIINGVDEGFGNNNPQINIDTFTISGVSGDAEEFAMQFTDTIKRELSVM